ncbi:LysR family transcriptional regulator [Paenibacillus sp. HB172176]|uniref:LysR family transcriptional regulator n=1 Tax=Paenibacillus sp. HB172176 TaxID=2493690 RepID=UPI00143B44E2|nr:LysR family transcriptional regulator [Paenibacillus sp. HB172176]
MEWQQIQYFQAAAELQHMTKAAERLSISQPALSRSIGKLEEELGVPLFDRQGRSIVLNAFGRSFHGHASRIMQEMEEARRDIEAMKDPQRGEISLSFLKSLGIRFVPNMAERFLNRYPHVDFKFYQSSTSMMLQQLKDGEIDFCLSSMTNTPPEIQWMPLWNEEMFIVVHPEHPLATRDSDSVSLTELIDQKFIALRPGYGSRAIFDEMLGSIGETPKIAFESDEVVSLLGFVSANLGIALLPRISGLNMEGVATLSISDYSCNRVIGLAWRKDKYYPPIAAAFKKFLIEEYKQEAD